MDPNRFDGLARSLAQPASRRTFGALVGILGSLHLPLLSDDAADAKSRRGQAAVHGERKKKKKKKKKCTGGATKCGKTCLDTSTDAANCGGCGVACATGQICQGGTCTCNGTLCSGCCADNFCQPGTIDTQCGANGAVCQVCTGGRACQSGVCTCPTGQTFCGGSCVDTRADSANCGGCGEKCTLPQTCGGGGTPGVCGCTKLTCQAGQCGAPPDGCGGTLDCGDDCDYPQICGGGGTPNVCGCLANGEVFTFEGNCDVCCSKDCCFHSPGISVCAGGCG